MTRSLALTALFCSVLFVVGCQPGSGAECAANDDCPEEQTCLTEFSGGYCGLADCEADGDCPGDSMCVRADSGDTFCFLMCADKPQCNANRSVDNEANCSSNVEPVDNNDAKACVPPSSGS